MPTSRDQGRAWRYTTAEPPGDLTSASYDDSGWKEDPGGFGMPGTPGARVRTTWDTPDIWLRRAIDLPDGRAGDVRLLMHLDEDADVFLNGVLATRARGFTTDYQPVRVRPEAAADLKPGKNVLAVHCHQIQGGQYIDVGLVRVEADTAR